LHGCQRRQQAEAGRNKPMQSIFYIIGVVVVVIVLLRLAGFA
jgi:predicted nucleic acid-binding Zn ribbon protein